MTDRLTGSVKFFNANKGYGFIRRDGGDDVFFHAKQLPAGVDEVDDGAPVTFEMEPHKRGPRARAIAFAGSSP